MTKKHFIAIADILNHNLKAFNGLNENIARQAILSTANGLSDYFAKVNPLFDRVKFDITIRKDLK